MIGEALMGDLTDPELRRLLEDATRVLSERYPGRRLVEEWEHLVEVARWTNASIDPLDGFRASGSAVARRRALNGIELAIHDVVAGRRVALPALVDLFDEAYLRFAHKDLSQKGSSFSRVSTTLARTAYQSRFCTPSILPDAEVEPMPAVYETSLSAREVAAEVEKVGERLKEVHDADFAFPFVDGSTGAIRAIAMWISKYGIKPLVGVNRIAHKSVIHALDSYCVAWYYLDEPRYDGAFDAAAPIDPSCIATALEERVRLDERSITTHVWVNSVTYEGVIAPVREVADEVARWAEGKVWPRPVLIVDEAWGAHFRFDEELKPQCALECGADIVTFSTHKAGGAKQGTAVLAARGSDVLDVATLAAEARGTITTSPNFPLIASLQAATNILDQEGECRIAISRRLAGKLATELLASGLAAPLTRGGNFSESPVSRPPCQDPLKVMIRLRGRSGFKVAAALEAEHGVVVEKDGFQSLLFLIPFQIDDVDVAIAATAAAKIAVRPAADLVGTVKPLDFPAARGNERRVPLDGALRNLTESRRLGHDLEGWVCTDIAAAYPPGVPVIVPGDRITSGQVRYLLAVHEGGGHVATGAGADGEHWPLVAAIPKEKVPV